MTIAASTRPRRSAVVRRAARAATQADTRRSRLQTICSVALVFGAGLHLNLGIAHADSNFGALSLLAAAAQLSLGITIVLWRVSALAHAVVLIELALLQLYLLNVTVGLPPAIAHTHDGGEQLVWGYAFALPRPIDLEGVIAVLTEVVGAASAAALLRTTRAKQHS